MAHPSPCNRDSGPEVYFHYLYGIMANQFPHVVFFLAHVAPDRIVTKYTEHKTYVMTLFNLFPTLFLYHTMLWLTPESYKKNPKTKTHPSK